MILIQLKNLISEIKRYPSLRYFGIALFLTHVLTFFFWRDQNLPGILADNTAPICWPFFPNCEIAHGYSKDLFTGILFVYFALAFLGIWFFYKRKFQLGIPLLLAVETIKLALQVMDYRFMGNYHFMIHIIHFFFLFVPQKEKSVKILLLLFYFCAGLLKLNYEWLSGASLGAVPFGSIYLLQMGCALAVILELFVVFLLFSKKSIYRYFAFGLFISFHLMSYFWVEYFYPGNMLLMLSIFPLSWHQGRAETLSSLLRTPNSPRTAIVFSMIFLSLQIFVTVLHDDSAQNGFRRLLTLNMYDARVDCLSSVWIKNQQQIIDYQPQFNLGRRAICDPIVFVSIAKNICRSFAFTPEPSSDLDLYLSSKTMTNLEQREILRIENFCGKMKNWDYFQWLAGDFR